MTSRSQGGGGQGFCYDSIKALVIKKHDDGGRVVKLSKIVWRHLLIILKRCPLIFFSRSPTPKQQSDPRSNDLHVVLQMRTAWMSPDGWRRQTHQMFLRAGNFKPLSLHIDASILPTFYKQLCDVIWPAFLNLQFMLVIFGDRKSAKKTARKMLAKRTTTIGRKLEGPPI